MMSLDATVALLLSDMRARAMLEPDDPPRGTVALRLEENWTSKAKRPPELPHLTRAQAAACLRLRDPRRRAHHWRRLHHSVRAALIRNGLCHRDAEPTELGDIVGRIAESVLGSTARAEGDKPPRAGDFRRRLR